VARDEAERIVAEMRTELEAARRSLERGQLTAPAIDSVLERADERLGRLPVHEAAVKGRGARAGAKDSGAADGAGAPATPAWRVGDEARSRSGGWTGRIAELDRSKRRATIETGAMRVSVEVADLEPADAASSGSGSGSGSGAGYSSGSPDVSQLAGTNVAQVRLSRARNVPMSLDLRGARVEEALSALDRYLEDASLAGLAKVSVIHGMGTGALRDAVRSDSAAHPLVKAVRAGERGEGGDGVTVVELG
jgi:DNA mismatch repair protein MutS2